MVLFAKLAHQRVAAEQTDFTDPPVAADVIQHAIGEQRLVRAVKRAKAEMDNTRAELAAIVLRVCAFFGSVAVAIVVILPTPV